MAKNIIETLKICITRNPLLNDILRPFKNQLNRTENGKKKAKIQQNFANIGKKRPKTAIKYLRYEPIMTHWSMIH